MNSMYLDFEELNNLIDSMDDNTLRNLARNELIEVIKDAKQAREVFMQFTTKIFKADAEKVINKCPIPLNTLIQAHLRIDEPIKKSLWPQLAKKFRQGKYILCPHCDFIFIRDTLKDGMIKGNEMLCYNCHNLFIIDWPGGLNENIAGNASLR